MKVGIFEAICRVNRLGKDMHPDLGYNSLKHRVVMFISTVYRLSRIRKWYAIADNPVLALALQRFPLTNGVIYWPYINHTWPMDLRLDTIDRHYRMLSGSAAIIAHASLNEVELARIEEYPGLRLVLDKAVWFLREGEVVLNLFVHDQRYYSIAFTLGIENEQPMIFVGALQGSNTEEAPEIYRNITHALHGMRPRDFLMVSLKMLCLELEVNKIWAVSNEYRQHNSPYFGKSHKEKVLVAYNDVWLEHGGTPLGNGFFEIPATIKLKDMSEIPSRKRATYRRRYEMLDKLSQEIKSSCINYSAKPLIVPTSA